MREERLQKILARAGITSRRKAESLIVQGRVAVNGRVVRQLGSRAVWGRDEIRVNGRLIEPAVEEVVVAFYKPRGCVTTLSEPQGRRSVGDLISGLPWRLYPVGRLDYDVEGLLLLTNDGELACRLQHPRYKAAKTYEVKVRGHPDEGVLERLQRGVRLKDGITAPAAVRVLAEQEKTTWLELTLRQGRYRQVKRMGAAVGHPVLRLRRTGVGPIELGSLRPGEMRRLNSREVRILRRAVGLGGR